MSLILASGSVRRAQLLEQCGIRFTVDVADVDESLDPEADPEASVQALALRKARKVFAKHPEDQVLGADTVVVIDGRIMGKPKDQDDAIRMLHELSGRTHQVLTGVALVYLGHEELFVSKTEVCFWPLTDKLIERYVAGGEPMDKAGAYGIQGTGALLVKWIKGDYYTVMGLPIARVYRLLEGVMTHD